MFRSTKTTILCTAVVFSTLICGAALAQRREAVQPQAAPNAAMPSLGEAGLVLDFANAQPEFRDALKPRNTEKIRALLINYGLSENVNVYDGPMDTTVPGGPYTNCYLAPMNVYYPAPTFSWPNHPRLIYLLICTNSAGGNSAFGWD